LTPRSVYTDEVRRRRGLELRLRVGLNSGEVVVRAIGNDLHMDHSAVGETTHLAARMEQMAMPGTIRLTAATLRLVEGLVRINALTSRWRYLSCWGRSAYASTCRPQRYGASAFCGTRDRDRRPGPDAAAG
jgi:class 3 adenylate cyclase